MLESFLSKFGPQTEEPEALPEMFPGSTDSFLEKFGGTQMEEYSFYGGTVQLMFDRTNWTWYLVGPLGELIEQYGVTSSLKVIDKSNMLVPWAAKMTIEKLLKTIPIETVDGLQFVPRILLSDFTRLALEAKSAHKDKLEDAGFVGHMAHEFIEKWIIATLAGTELPEIKLDDERAVSCVNAFMKWHNAHNVRWVSTEQKIYSQEHHYAGTLDGTAIYSSCTDRSCCLEQFVDQLVIMDFKTSNALRLEYILQVSSYRKAYLEEHKVAINHGVILRLGKEDGEFESLQLNEQDFEKGYVGFLACLSLLIAIEIIEALWKDKKANIKAAKKELNAIAKEIKKAEEKVQKAEAKAQAKLLREAEKLRMKDEAKIERARLKAEVKKQTEIEEQHKPIPIPTEEN